MHVFYAPDVAEGVYELGEDESRHCSRVLRVGVGGVVRLVDGRGGMYEGRVCEAGRRCVVDVVRLGSDWGKRGYRLTMAVAPTKNAERFEWFLEKATEIGCDVFVPLLCERSERRTVNMERLERVITSAVKQSQTAWHPRLEPLTPFAEFVVRPFDGVRTIAHCAEGAKDYVSSLVRPGDDVLILIGPEGDFSPTEVAGSHCRAVSLGDSRLRTETAAIAATLEVAIINRKTE